MSAGHRIKMCGHVCLTVAVDRGTKPAALGVVVLTRGCEIGRGVRITWVPDRAFILTGLAYVTEGCT